MLMGKRRRDRFRHPCWQASSFREFFLALAILTVTRRIAALYASAKSLDFIFYGLLHKGDEGS